MEKDLRWESEISDQTLQRFSSLDGTTVRGKEVDQCWKIVKAISTREVLKHMSDGERKMVSKSKEGLGWQMR